MGKGTIKKRIENILEDGPKGTHKIMDELKRYRDCPTTNQLGSLLGVYFDSIGETKTVGVNGWTHSIKVWSLRDSEQKV